jgi:hypothetical protein
MTLNRLVRLSIGTLAAGKWAATTAKLNKVSGVLVAFADQVDFAAAQTHHKGKTWAPPIAGASGGLFVTLP